MKRIKLLLLTLIACPALLASSIETYNGVETMRSASYEIEVKQNGVTQSSFVYEDENKFTDQEHLLSERNHWTNFSFKGKPITISIKLLKENNGRFELRPREKGIELMRDGNTLSFTLSKPEKLYLWSENDTANPLFIFANKIDKKPDPKDPNVVYWGDGVHEIGKHYLLKSNTTYYISGGAYLKGSFLSEENAKNITMCGRGIISGEEIEHGPYKKYKFDRMALRLLGHGNTNFNIEGITFINPGQYCIQAYGGELHTANVKCFGWWHETDGWVGGDNSTLKDSFFKVYDDIIKIYFDNLKIKDITIYKQQNGAVFQFGWSNETSNNATAKNIYVVCDETQWNEKTMHGNRGFINTAGGNKPNNVSNFNVSHIRYDEDLSYLLGINSQGTYKGITITDMIVAGKQRFKSYLSGGNISGVKLKNVMIDGEQITTDQQLELETGGTVAPIMYK